MDAVEEDSRDTDVPMDDAVGEDQDVNGVDDLDSVQGEDNDSQDEEEEEGADPSVETVADAVKKRKRTVAHHRRFATSSSKPGSNSVADVEGRELFRSDFSFRDFRPALHPIACKCVSVEEIDPTDTENEVPPTIDYRCDNRQFWLSDHDCQVPTPTSQNLELEQQIRIFGGD